MAAPKKKFGPPPKKTEVLNNLEEPEIKTPTQSSDLLIDGRTVRKTKAKTQMNLNVPFDFKNRLFLFASENNKFANDLIVQVMTEYMDKHSDD